MSITIDLPPAMAQEARDYAIVHGTTLERLFLDYLRNELRRRHETGEVMTRLDALVRKTSTRLTGEAYKFNRADAYPEGEFA